MAEAIVPKYTYAQLMNIINNEARACASNRKSGLRNMFTRIDALEADCKNGLINGKYKADLEAAAYYENINAANVNAAFNKSLGLSNQTIAIILAALAVLLIVALLYKQKTN